MIEGENIQSYLDFHKRICKTMPTTKLHTLYLKKKAFLSTFFSFCNHFYALRDGKNQKVLSWYFFAIIKVYCKHYKTNPRTLKILKNQTKLPLM